MMDFLKSKEMLAKEGFAHVYEWTDAPFTAYPEHSHKGRVSIVVTQGSVVFTMRGVEKVLNAGDRFDVPVGVPHTAEVGAEGASFVVGEEIEGDS